MVRQNCYQDPITWNRYTIGKVLKKNPALKEALELLGIDPVDLATKAEEKYARQKQLQDEHQYLNSCVHPDHRVGPATTERLRVVGAKSPTLSLQEVAQQGPKAPKKKFSPGAEETVIRQLGKKKYGGLTNVIHVGYSLGDPYLGYADYHARASTEGYEKPEPTPRDCYQVGELEIKHRDGGVLSIPEQEGSEGE